jgi:hypothetical protein
MYGLVGDKKEKKISGLTRL